MTDLEMLMKAAKAAGLDVECAFTSGDLHVWTHRDMQLLRLWNPLKDDGDALRLAVKLELQMRLRHSENEVSVFGCPEGRIDESVMGDPYAATRRAIVRAAAALADAGGRVE